MNPIKFVKQWLAEITVHESIVTLRSHMPEELELRIGRLLGQPDPRLETAPNGTILVYHPSYEKGEQPLGWIAGFEVPEELTIDVPRPRNVAAA